MGIASISHLHKEINAWRDRQAYATLVIASHGFDSYRFAKKLNTTAHMLILLIPIDISYGIGTTVIYYIIDTLSKIG